MTEKSSNYGLRYYLFRMGQIKSCTVFNIIFALCGFPTFTLAQVLMSFSGSFDEISSGILVIGIIGILGVCIMSYITPIIALKYLYSKNSADNILSLPLTVNQRYFADIFSIFTSFHIPYAFSLLLTYIILAVSEGIFRDAGYGFGQEWYYFQYAVISFFLLLVFCTLNTAIITCCGRVLEAVIYPIVLNIVLPLMVVLGMYISYSNAFGLSSIVEEIFGNYLLLLFPFSAFFSQTDLILYGLTPKIIIQVFVAVLYLALAFIAYKKRHAENIGKSFVFKYSYLIISSVVSIAFIFGYTSLSGLSTVNGKNIAGSIAITAVILFILMLVMEVVNYRKIKGIIKFLLRYAVTLACGIGLCFLLKATAGFGASYYIPAAEEIESASLNFSYSKEYNPDPYSTTYFHTHENYLDASEKEGLELIRKAHKHVIDNYTEEKTSDNAAYITYNLKNGKEVRRYYVNGFEETDNYWKEVVESESFRLSRLSSFCIRVSDYGGEKINAFRVKNPNSDVVYFTEELPVAITESDLIEALRTDLINDTEYGRHDDYPLAALHFGRNEITYDDYILQTPKGIEFFSYSEEFMIYENYTNTIAFLSQYGTLPTAEEAIEDSTNNCDVYTVYRVKNFDSHELVIQPHFYQDADMIFITRDEYKELSKYQSEYAYSSDEGYIYKVIRGMWTPEKEYSAGEYISAYEEIGGQNSNAVRSDAVYDLEDNYRTVLNECVYEKCDKMFDNRTAFHFKNY